MKSLIGEIHSIGEQVQQNAIICLQEVSVDWYVLVS